MRLLLCFFISLKNCENLLHIAYYFRTFFLLQTVTGVFYNSMCYYYYSGVCVRYLRAIIISFGFSNDLKLKNCGLALLKSGLSPFYYS